MTPALFDVKKGMNPAPAFFSGGGAKLAPNPMDYPQSSASEVGGFEGMVRTPLATRRLTMLSSPTNAPLRMNSTFDVSMKYVSGFAVIPQHTMS